MTTTIRKQRTVFTDELDIIMLRETLATYAYYQEYGSQWKGTGWRTVYEKLSELPDVPPSLTTRAIRDRCNILMAHHKELRLELIENNEMTEKDELLEQIYRLEGREKMLSNSEMRERGPHQEKVVLGVNKPDRAPTLLKTLHRVSFNDDMDVLMLREVLACQPFFRKEGAGWREATEHLLQLPNFPPIMTFRTVRERTKLLMKHYQKKTPRKGRRSAIDEISEKSILLEEILLMKEEREKWGAKEEGDEMKATGQVDLELTSSHAQQFSSMGDDDNDDTNDSSFMVAAMSDVDFTASMRDLISDTSTLQQDASRFTSAMDEELLTNVLSINPWLSSDGWKEIAHSLKSQSFGLTVEDIEKRIKTLLANYRAENRDKTKDESPQMEKLLQYVSEIEYDFTKGRQIKGEFDVNDADAAKVPMMKMIWSDGPDDRPSTVTEQDDYDNDNDENDDDHVEQNVKIEMECEDVENSDRQEQQCLCDERSETQSSTPSPPSNRTQPTPTCFNVATSGTPLHSVIPIYTTMSSSKEELIPITPNHQRQISSSQKMECATLCSTQPVMTTATSTPSASLHHLNTTDSLVGSQRNHDISLSVKDKLSLMCNQRVKNNSFDVQNRQSTVCSQIDNISSHVEDKLSPIRDRRKKFFSVETEQAPAHPSYSQSVHHYLASLTNGVDRKFHPYQRSSSSCYSSSMSNSFDVNHLNTSSSASVFSMSSRAPTANTQRLEQAVRNKGQDLNPTVNAATNHTSFSEIASTKNNHDDCDNLVPVKQQEPPEDWFLRLKEKEIHLRKLDLELRKEELNQRKREIEFEREREIDECHLRRSAVEKEEKQKILEALSKVREDVSELKKQQMTMMNVLFQLVNDKKKNDNQ